MSPKKGDSVAPPAIGSEWRVRYCTNQAIKAGKPTKPHHQLKGSLAYGTHNGQVLPCWQIEVTGGDRIWYLLDADRRTVWVQYAGPHPKATE
ncbi:hypothetical protein JOF41_005978 [Saccharothrix coeruleofusca]|uniref:hypothetical protein n=1 Tax=Saccharothrix coeruleofusca TaxID=33919 RepID=UPI001AE2877E|nr:hypothetical protein [Saccharothrix coeruleofusca]MBP2339800.1 hypothetical protein [Saccharothrix coeruleofusca]